MAVFRYEGTSFSGQRMIGVVEAFDVFEALEKARATCRVVSKVTPVKERSNFLTMEVGSGRIKPKVIAIMCSQFATIISAGMSMSRCVELVADQTSDKGLKAILMEVADDVSAGHSLATSFENKGGKKLAERFAEEGIERLDAMIITHFDKDHVGGADKILESVSVARVILPQYEKESKQYAQFMEALEQSAQTEREILPAGGEWSETFGQTRLRVTAAERTDYGADEENDFSLATYLTYGETKFLFPGDAEDARQTELLRAGDIDCDVLKVPYHGRLVDASAAFLAACSPKIAFIPDSDEEAASPMVVAILKELRTDVHSGRDGDLVVVSDGKDVFVKQ